jgi:hypothetical protein
MSYLFETRLFFASRRLMGVISTERLAAHNVGDQYLRRLPS